MSLAFIVVALLMGDAAVGQKTWDGGGDGVNWGSPNNWNPNGVPTASDDVIIAAGTSVNVNVSATCASLTLQSGTSTASSLTGSGTLTLAGNVTVTSTGTGATGATISCPVALTDASTRTFDVADGNATADLTISGVISTTGALTKSGTGTLLLSGANTYSGLTTISAGSIQLGSTSALGSTAAGTIVASNATLDLNGMNYTAAEALTLNGNGLGNIGALRNTSATGAIYGGLLTLGSDSRIVGLTGTITISNPGTITGDGFLLTLAGGQGGTIESIIGTGSGGIDKVTAAGTWTLSGANTYSGLTQIITGTLKLGSTSALGSTASGTVIASGAVLDLNGINYNATEALTVNGTGLSNGGAIINSSSSGATYGGLLTLGSDSRIVGETGTISISNPGTITGAGFGLTLGGSQGGIISSIIGTGSGSLTKTGSGTWTLSGANTHSGGTVVNAGNLVFGITSTGNVTNGPVGTGTLTMNGGTISSLVSGYVIANPIAIGGHFTVGGNVIVTFSGNVTVNGDYIVTITNNTTNGTVFSGNIDADASGNNRILTFAGNGVAMINDLFLNGNIGSVQPFRSVIVNNKIHKLVVNGAISLNATAGGEINLACDQLMEINAALNSNNKNITLTNLGDGAAFNGITITSAANAGTGNIAITGVGGTSTGGGLTMTSGGNLTTTSGSIQITGSAQVSTGEHGVELSSGTIIQTTSGNITINGNGATSNGKAGIRMTGSGTTVTSASGNISITGTGATTGAGSTYNPGIHVSDGAIISTTGSGTITLEGRRTSGSTGESILFSSNAGTLGGGSGNITIVTTSGDAALFGGVITGSGTLIKEGSLAATLSAANTYMGGTTLNAGTLNINNVSALGASVGTFTISGGNIDNTSGVNITTVSYPLALNSDFTYIGSVPSGNLNLGNGNVSISADRQITVSNGTLTIGGVVSEADKSLTKAGAGTLSFASSAVGLLNITNNAGTLRAPNASGAFNVSGNWSNNGTFTHNNGTVTFNSDSPKTIGGSNETTFYSLIKNSGSTLTLNKRANIANSLALDGGIIMTDATNFLNFNDNATVSGGSNTAHVDGPIRKTGDDAFVFPSGKEGLWARIGISAPSSATDAFTAEYFKEAHSNTNSLDNGVNNVSTVEYWNLERTAGTSAVTVTLYFENGPYSIINNLTTSDIFVGHYNTGTSKWEDLGGTRGVSGTTSAGTVSMDGVNNFSDFTFASENGANLPVELVSFTGTCQGENTMLKWTTASEFNSDYFIIESSKNGTDWYDIDRVIGAGFSAKAIDYHWVITVQKPEDLFYRLKQMDYDGSSNYSKIIFVKSCFQVDQNILAVFPNPSKGVINIHPTKDSDEIKSVVVFNVSGQQVFETKFVSNQINLSHLSNGQYYLQIKGERFNEFEVIEINR